MEKNLDIPQQKSKTLARVEEIAKTQLMEQRKYVPLRRWEADGKIGAIRTLGGQRRYCIEQYQQETKPVCKSLPERRLRETS